MADNKYISELHFRSPGDIDIHLVSLGDQRDQYGMFVSIDGGGSLIALFNDNADLAAVIAFIMALQTAEPVAATDMVKDLLFSINPGEPTVDPV